MSLSFKDYVQFTTIENVFYDFLLVCKDQGMEELRQ